jgi:amino-acid N-acetyltransferase
MRFCGERGVRIVKPTLKDIFDIKRVVEPYVKEGIILNRDDDEIAQNIRSYLLAYNQTTPIGVGALHIYSPYLAEIRSLAVDRAYQNRGVGREIVKELLKEAKRLDVKEVLVLTYKKEFFERLGFIEIGKEAIPDKKIWADCIKCKFFPNCNEVALLKRL